MDALDFISLAEAKYALVVDYPDKDGDITRYIKTSVALVERITNYALYQRANTYTIPSCGYLEIYDYPLNLTTTGLTFQYNVLSTTIRGESGLNVVGEIGYVSSADVPSPLKDACMKIITYLFENRDVYEADLPFDVQLLLNPYKRSATI